MSSLVINSHNEWDPLQEVIVGIADNAKYPVNDLGMNANIAWDAKTLPSTRVAIPDISKSMIEETNAELEIMVTELTRLGISVKRPDPIDTRIPVKTPYWHSAQYFNYCPRDTMFVIGDTIYESPNFYRSRYFETFSYHDILVEYLQNGGKWVSAPKPRLRDEDYNLDPDTPTTLNNHDPIFDAAGIMRAGKDIFYLVSNSGNELGYTWLKNVLGDTYRVHPVRNIYQGTHIDTTLALLRPGLALANPIHLNEENMPEILRKWEIIYCPPMEEHLYSKERALSSKWLGMNMLMINPNLAMVDADQHALIKLLEHHKIDVLPLKLRDGRQLEGGFHCVTLDVHRTGKLEDYFS